VNEETVLFGEKYIKCLKLQRITKQSGFEHDPCIYYALSLPTELSSQGLKFDP